MDENEPTPAEPDFVHDPFSLGEATSQILNVALEDLLARISEGPVTIEAGSEEAAILTGLAEAAATYASAIAEVYNYSRDFAVA